MITVQTPESRIRAKRSRALLDPLEEEGRDGGGEGSQSNRNVVRGSAAVIVASQSVIGWDSVGVLGLGVPDNGSGVGNGGRSRNGSMLDVEGWGRSEDGFVGSAVNDVEAVVGSRGGPTSTGRIQCGVSEVSIDQSSENLVKGHQVPVRVGEDDGEVGSVSVITVPDEGLRTMVCPALGLVRNKDGVGQRRGGVGEAGGEDDAHVGP